MFYKLSPSAKKDLREIWNYTVDKWGERQANSYIKNIFECFDEIANRKIIFGHAVISNRKFKVVRCEHHYIYFTAGKELVISAILHKKRDFISVLKKRLPA